MIHQLSLVLMIPFLAISGWGLRLSHRERKDRRLSPIKPHRGYYVGLNYLINDQPDEAIFELLKLLETESDTIEIHLALGSLFRRRGEVDRAIQIHQSLVTKETLTLPERNFALAELGQDYLHAGFLDRAEELFQHLIRSGEKTEAHLRRLLSIYEQTQSWKQAVETAEEIERLGVTDMALLIGHYYCELAEENMATRHWGEAEKFLKKALARDEQCVRASLLVGRLKIQEDQLEKALVALQKVEKQNPLYLPEAIPLLAICYQRLFGNEAWGNYLQSCVEQYPLSQLIVFLTRYLWEQEGAQAAMTCLSRYGGKTPSLVVLHQLVQVGLEEASSPSQGPWALLKQQLEKMLAKRSVYQCRQCGFSANTLYWKCPGCKTWGSAKPVE